MSAYIGVSRTLSFLNLRPGDSNFWCVGGSSSRAKPGDQLLLYIPVAQSSAKQGIAQVYEIVSSVRDLPHSPCYNYGMTQVTTKLILNLREHVTMRDLKSEPGVQQWGAVRRNMQGVTFTVGSHIWPALRAMIVMRDPKADAILEPANA